MGELGQGKMSIHPHCSFLTMWSIFEGLSDIFHHLSRSCRKTSNHMSSYQSGKVIQLHPQKERRLEAQPLNMNYHFHVPNLIDLSSSCSFIHWQTFVLSHTFLWLSSSLRCPPPLSLRYRKRQHILKHHRWGSTLSSAGSHCFQ